MRHSSEDILSHAIRLPHELRDAYLRDVCGGNAPQQAEISELLRIHDAYPAPPPSDDTHEENEAFPDRVEEFRFERELGRGGMGRVFLSRDTRLGRQVAVKVLSGRTSDDPDRVRRFEREARILAALEHPNIAAVYRFGRDHGRPYFVMEYLPGATLRERLREGPLDREEARAICLQAAEGLAAAHRAGVVHRDLKPSNISASRDGRVKLLDFGIAKVLDDDDADYTVTGGLLGSPGYASPEQLRGEPADPRSDAWSFGCILFECLSGEPAFPGATGADRLTAVLTKEPNWQVLPEDVSHGTKWLLRKCLTRDTLDRMRDFDAIADVIRSGTTSRVQIDAHPLRAPRRRVRQPRRARWAVPTALLALAGTGFLLHALTGPPRDPGGTVARERQITFAGDVRAAEIAPDGRTMAIVVDGRSLDLLDTETHERKVVCNMARVGAPTWSTDGEELFFIGDERRGGGNLRSYVAERATGRVRLVGPEGFRGSAVTADAGRVLGNMYVPGELPVMCALDRATGDTTTVPLPVAFAHSPSIACSPVADIVLLAGQEQETTEISFWIHSLESQRATRILRRADISYPTWRADGRAIIFCAGETLSSLSVDPDTGTPEGPPRVILDRVKRAVFSVSGTGNELSIAYVRGHQSTNLWSADAITPAWAEHGEWRRLTRGTFADQMCRLDSGGENVAFVRRAGDRHDIYSLSIADGELTRLTYSRTQKNWPAWSPDQRRVAYVQRQVGIRIVDRDGTRDACIAKLCNPSYLYWPWPDRLLFHCQRDQDRNYRFLELDTASQAPLFPKADGRTVFQSSVSPDGSTMAVAGNRGFEYDLRVWLIDLADRSERLLYGGWAAPFAWSPDGEWVFLITDDPELKTGQESVILRVHVESGAVERLLECPGVAAGWSSISMSADGRRIVCAIRDIQRDAWLVEGVAS